jgi:hypothetical protein
MKEIKILCNCNKCGKQAPIDSQMSNDNWTFYNTKDPCSCGGKFITCFVEEDNTPILREGAKRTWDKQENMV